MLFPQTARIWRFWKLSKVYSCVKVSRYPAGKPTRSTLGAGSVCECATCRNDPAVKTPIKAHPHKIRKRLMVVWSPCSRLLGYSHQESDQRAMTDALISI